MNVRQLQIEDADAYRALRAEGLRLEPKSFLSSPGDDRFEAPGAAEESIAGPHSAIFGSFESVRLVSSVGVLQNTRPKIAHMAEIVGVYTTPDARGKGHSRACMTAAIIWARARHVRAIRLGVSVDTPAARALYESLGFVAWGTEPESMLVDGVYHDEIYMQLRL